jgi:hypothetical protein
MRSFLLHCFTSVVLSVFLLLDEGINVALNSAIPIPPARMKYINTNSCV